MSNHVQDCIDDLTAKLESVAQVKSKVFTVYNEEDLMDQMKGVVGRGLGVSYLGMTAWPEIGTKDSHRIGLSCTANYAIIVVNPKPPVITKQQISPLVSLLDNLRDSIKNTRAPTGHFWRFVAETPAVIKGSNVVWVQRWAVPVQLHN